MRRLLLSATVSGGLAIAFITVHDGTIGGRAARLLLVVLAAALVGYATECGSDGVRGWSAILAGTIAAAVGAGIAGPHLAKTGLTPLAIAGAVALLAGVVLVVGGSTILVRARRGWRRFAVVPARAGLRLRVRVDAGAGCRRDERASHAVAIAAGSLDSSAEDVTFETRDHVTLSGWFIPSRNGAAVVLAHGAGSTRASVRAHAEVLARHGFGVLAFDARGHGRSEGRAMDFGWYGDEDVGAAVAFVRGRPGVDANRIGAVGLSMGGEEVIGAAATNPGIRAVVAEGATARTRSDKAWLSDEFGVAGLVAGAARECDLRRRQIC